MNPITSADPESKSADILAGNIGLLKSLFPELITGPFHAGLIVVFGAAAAMMVVGAIASMFSAGRYGAERVSVERVSAG